MGPPVTMKPLATTKGITIDSYKKLLPDSLEPTPSPPPTLLLFCKSQGSLQSQEAQRLQYVGMAMTSTVSIYKTR
ncbi:L-Dopachrome Tautomerase [Manis pentadactyla]|nr:L-Dopachrome Tautomerase [Manis pentadactyla]